MVIGAYKIPGPDEGPGPGARWTLMFEGASNALGHVLYPKNFPPIFLQDILIGFSNAQGCSRIDHTNSPPKQWNYN